MGDGLQFSRGLVTAFDSFVLVPSLFHLQPRPRPHPQSTRLERAARHDAVLDTDATASPRAMHTTVGQGDAVQELVQIPTPKREAARQGVERIKS